MNHQWELRIRIYSEWMNKLAMVKVIGVVRGWSSVCLCSSILKCSEQQTGCIRSSPEVSCNIERKYKAHLIGCQLCSNIFSNPGSWARSVKCVILKYTHRPWKLHSQTPMLERCLLFHFKCYLWDLVVPILISRTSRTIKVARTSSNIFKSRCHTSRLHNW